MFGIFDQLWLWIFIIGLILFIVSIIVYELTKNGESGVSVWFYICFFLGLGLVVISMLIYVFSPDLPDRSDNMDDIVRSIGLSKEGETQMQYPGYPQYGQYPVNGPQPYTPVGYGQYPQYVQPTQYVQSPQYVQSTAKPLPSLVNPGVTDPMLVNYGNGTAIVPQLPRPDVSASPQAIARSQLPPVQPAQVQGAVFQSPVQQGSYVPINQASVIPQSNAVSQVPQPVNNGGQTLSSMIYQSPGLTTQVAQPQVTSSYGQPIIMSGQVPQVVPPPQQVRVPINNVPLQYMPQSQVPFYASNPQVPVQYRQAQGQVAYQGQVPVQQVPVQYRGYAAPQVQSRQGVVYEQAPVQGIRPAPQPIVQVQEVPVREVVPIPITQYQEQPIIKYTKPVVREVVEVPYVSNVTTIPVVKEAVTGQVQPVAPIPLQGVQQGVRMPYSQVQVQAPSQQFAQVAAPQSVGLVAPSSQANVSQYTSPASISQTGLNVYSQAQPVLAQSGVNVPQVPSQASQSISALQQASSLSSQVAI